jgi:conjugal transfer pilus assembly protein TraF
MATAIHFPQRAVGFTALIATLTASAGALAQGTPTPGNSSGGDEPRVDLREDYAEHFLRYEPLTTAPKPSQAPSVPQQAPATATAAAPKGAQPVDVQWLRKNLPVLQQRMIDHPTPENASAFLYAQRIAMDKAQRYAAAQMAAVNADPFLNENNRVPYASMGATAVRNADLRAQQTAARELSKIGGLFVFVDARCRFCKAQLPIVEQLHRMYGIEYVVVSIDGEAMRGAKVSVTRDTGLFGKLGLRLTPSIVFVPRPHGYQGADPNLYLVVSQGFYALDELVKQIAFAGHAKALLSPATMADLAVWERGVLGVDDLDHLELDVNDPASFAETIRPLLIKQY